MFILQQQLNQQPPPVIELVAILLLTLGTVCAPIGIFIYLRLGKEHKISNLFCNLTNPVSLTFSHSVTVKVTTLYGVFDL